MSRQTPDNFIAWLDACLKDHGWSDRQLAQKAGIAPSAISKARSGYQALGWDASAAIAKALEIPPVVVFTKIGLLSPHSDERSPNAEEMVSLFSNLGEEDQDELLQMARLKLERKKRGAARGKKSGT